MNSYSQAGQDLFVRALCPYGLFLDIGAAGRSISNTLALEENGWRGICIDNSPEAEADHKGRTNSRFIRADATQLDYCFLPTRAQYLSLDIDGASLSALMQLPLDRDRVRFDILTLEHDFYARGESLRTPMLEILRRHGYDILCADVCHEGKPFETWAVHPQLVDMTVAEKFRRTQPTDWKEILHVD